MLAYPLDVEGRCCAPTEWCGMPRIERKEIVRLAKIKDYNDTNKLDIYPATLREVGPLNNNVREAPITTIMYRRMYCATIPYQHPAPRNPAMCYAGQPKGTHITTVLPPIRERLSTNAQVLAKESP